MAGSPGQQLV
uniref:Uncharacterized protein n=1 Tax=Arundo donax TaxID=35708 RepID=A0A0A9FD56_ARUDO